MVMRQTLDRVALSTRVEVVDIRGGWGVRQRLNQLGIHPGDHMMVKRSGIFHGPVLIAIHGCDVAIGRGMARHVIVREIT